MLKKKDRNKSIYKVLGLAFIAVFSFMIVKGIVQQPKITDNETKIAELEQKIEYEKNRIDEIENMKTKVDSDEYIEKVARDKLGMIKRDEIVFVDISGQGQ